MAADLGLVAHAAEGDPDERAAHGPGDRLAQRGLADTRGARPGPGSCPPAALRDRLTGCSPFGPSDRSVEPALDPQLADGQVLDDAILDVVQTGVVGVEHRPGLADVEPVIGPLAPRQLEHGVEPGADPAVLGALLAGALQLVDLLA